MKIKTICAWCESFISEGDFEVSEHCQTLAIDGVVVSHGYCKKCKLAMVEEYKLNLRRKRYV